MTLFSVRSMDTTKSEIVSTRNSHGGIIKKTEFIKLRSCEEVIKKVSDSIDTAKEPVSDCPMLVSSYPIG